MAWGSINPSLSKQTQMLTAYRLILGCIAIRRTAGSQVHYTLSMSSLILLCMVGQRGVILSGVQVSKTVCGYNLLQILLNWKARLYLMTGNLKAAKRDIKGLLALDFRNPQVKVQPFCHDKAQQWFDVMYNWRFSMKKVSRALHQFKEDINEAPCKIR